MRLHNIASAIELTAVVAAFSACMMDEDSISDIVDTAVNQPDVDTISQAIIDGIETTEYPETALINVPVSSSTATFWRPACSGVVLAPSIVLTAAHCLVGQSNVQVHVPATGQKIETDNKLIHPSYRHGAPLRSMGLDSGLLFLKSKINLSRFPHMTESPMRTDERLKIAGRTFKAVPTNKVYKSPEREVEILPINNDYYATVLSTEFGDSGGPHVRLDHSPALHPLMAITHGAGVDSTGKEVATLGVRVDRMYDWLVGEIQRYTRDHRDLAPSCPASGYTCSLSPIGGGLPCTARDPAGVLLLAYCCDIPGERIENGRCNWNDAPGPAPAPTPTVEMWQVAGHVRDQNMVGVPGVVVQVWGIGAAGYRKHYDSVTDTLGNFKVGGFIVKGGMYDVIIANNTARVGQGAYRYPAYTSWQTRTRDQVTRKDTPLGSLAYMNQKAGSADCASEDTTRSGAKRCDFIYTRTNSSECTI